MEAEDLHAAGNPSLELEEDGIGWLVFNDPSRPLNLFTREVMSGLARALEEVRSLVGSGRLRALVLWSGKEDSFFGGAEVSAIEEVRNPQEGETVGRLGQVVFQTLADLPCPTISAIHGVCLGGGLEMSLACKHRGASDSGVTRLGFPEVLLGILPAWGGTTRLSRLLGLRKSLPLLLTGKRISGVEAEGLGLVDRAFPVGRFREGVEKWALTLAESEGAHPGMGDPGASPSWQRLPERGPPGIERVGFFRTLILGAARRRIRARTGGHYPAPEVILEVLDLSWGKPLDTALAAEAEALGRLIASPVSKKLIRIFRLREDARKVQGVAAGKPDWATLAGPLLTAQREAARALLEGGATRKSLRGGARSFGFLRDPLSGRMIRGRGPAPTAPGSVEGGRRLALPMVSRAAEILEEGLASRAGLVDLALVMEKGFPPFRGGLLDWADEVGLDSVVQELDTLVAQGAPSFLPSSALRRLAAGKTTFYERYP